MLLLPPLYASTKLATPMSLVLMSGGSMITNAGSYFHSQELLLRTECTTCGRNFVNRHELISTLSDSNVFRPMHHLPLTSTSSCIVCGDTSSRLLLTEVSWGEPITEVQVNRPYV